MISNLQTQIFIVITALCGFCVALYIYNKKNNKKKLICPLRSNCTNVITSKYATIAGIPIETLGIAYYLFIIVSHLGLIFLPWTVTPFVLNTGFLISFSAVCFSTYLIYVQAVILKEWCSWCLTSAFLSVIIFILTILSFF